MSSNWEVCTLGDILTLQRGMDLPAQDRKVGHVPIVASNGVVGYHNHAPARGPGVLIGRSGSIGGGQYIEEDYWPLNTTLWVKDFKGNNPRFCYYLLRSIDFSSLNAGSGVPTLNRNHLHPMPLSCPPLHEQVGIATILASLDDRITLLRETNATLEAIAQALFKSWFVDFDPVRAKAEGREPEGMPAEVADLFPSEFEETELGEMPKGWKVGTVKDLGEVICGKTPPTSDPQNFGDEVQFITIPDMHNRLLVSSTARYLSFKGADSQKNKYLPIGSICVSCIATPGLVVQTTGISQTNQQINSVIPDAKLGSSFALFALQKLGSLVRQSGLGGTVFHNLNKSGFENLQLLLPSQAIAQRFSEFSDTFLNSIKLNQEQIDSLADLRDTLLPRLMSGKLRIPDLEEQAA